MVHETRVLQTKYGEREIEVVVCDSCGQTGDEGNAYQRTIEDKHTSERTDTVVWQTEAEGHTCENCIEKDRLMGTPLVRPKLRVDIDPPSYLSDWTVPTLTFLFGMLTILLIGSMGKV